jgi:hypothetical protein
MKIHMERAIETDVETNPQGMVIKQGSSVVFLNVEQVLKIRAVVNEIMREYEEKAAADSE